MHLVFDLPIEAGFGNACRVSALTVEKREREIEREREREDAILS